MTTRLNRELNTVCKADASANGTTGKRLWQKIIMSPETAIVAGDNFSSILRMINPKPIVAITSKITLWNPGSKYNPKFTNVNSRRINQSPRLIKNFLVSTMLVFLRARYTDVPARKTKMGAHKYVIQRVKKSKGVVVSRLVGFCVMDCECIISRTWSSAIMIITRPRVKSMLLILLNVVLLFILLKYTQSLPGVEENV